MRGRAPLSFLVAVLLLLATPAAAQYRFLGNMRSYERTASGVAVRCEPGMRLDVRFLTPRMFRVTLVRPGFDEPLLDYPIAKTAWDPVAVRFTEERARLTLRTDSVTLVVGRAPCRLTVLDPQGRVVSQDDPGMGIGWDGPEVRNWKVIAPSDHFFGLGEKTGGLDKRENQWVMWNSDTPGYNAETDPIYQSVPFFIGLRDGNAYGIYFNNSHRTTFNFGAGNHRYYSFAAEHGPLDYFFIYGPDVPQVVATYTLLTGRTPMPPKWALGYQQSRWSYYPEAEVMRLARTFREKRIPADVIYLDIHYMNGYRVFTWDRERFPDPARMLRQLQDMGFKVVTIIDPGVKVDSAYEVAREGLSGGHFVRYPDGQIYVGSVWPGPAYFPDFSRAQTRAWWGSHLARLMELGVDGIWNDMNEPAVWGRAFPLEVLMDDGGHRSSQKKMHNLYGFLMARTAYEELRRARPNERPFVLTRAGFAGEQRYTAVWTGDNVASEEHLELGIRMLQGLGISGVPFVGTDVGGFIGTPSPELFARWIQVGTFSPFFRAHTTAGTPDQEPWSFGEEVEAISERYISLRYRMLPYLYSLFWESHETGSPILRPLLWRNQRDTMVYHGDYQQQFLVGEHLLVAPVTRVGQNLKKVYLPAGTWLDLNTDSVYQGGRSVVVDAPMDVLPMFLGAGGILPMQEPEQYVDERKDSTLTLDVFATSSAATTDGAPAGPGGRFDLFEDDGGSYGYERGAYRLTRFEVSRSEAELSFSREVRHDGYRTGDRLLDVRFHAVPTEPRTVMLDQDVLPRIHRDERRQGFFYDAERKIVTTRFREGNRRQEVRVR